MHWLLLLHCSRNCNWSSKCMSPLSCLLPEAHRTVPECRRNAHVGSLLKFDRHNSGRSPSPYHTTATLVQKNQHLDTSIHQIVSVLNFAPADFRSQCALLKALLKLTFSDLFCGTVWDISTIPKSIDANLLELGSRSVGVEALPRVQNHLARRQQVQRVLCLRCWLWLFTISLQLTGTVNSHRSVSRDHDRRGCLRNLNTGQASCIIIWISEAQCHVAKSRAGQRHARYRLHRLTRATVACWLPALRLARSQSIWTCLVL